MVLLSLGKSIPYSEVVEEADLRDFGEFGEALGKIKVAFACFNVPDGWLYIISAPSFIDNPLAAFVAAFARQGIRIILRLMI